MLKSSAVFDRLASSNKHQKVKVFVVLQYCLTVDMHKKTRWNLIDAGILIKKDIVFNCSPLQVLLFQVLIV